MFFLNYFKYYDDQSEMVSGSSAHRDAIFEALYKALLSQRVKYEDKNFLTRNWVRFIKEGHFVNEAMNTDQAKFIPVIKILTAVLFDASIPYNSKELTHFDDKLTYFNAISQNNQFLVDYKKFNGNGFPEIKVETLRSIVIPQVGDVTEAEHAVLSNPSSLKLVKENLKAGKKLFKMTDLDPSFESDEDVYVYLYEKNDAVCNDPAADLAQF